MLIIYTLIYMHCEDVHTCSVDIQFETVSSSCSLHADASTLPFTRKVFCEEEEEDKQ